MSMIVGWVEPPGPAFGRPDDKLSETHRANAANGNNSIAQGSMGFASPNPSYALIVTKDGGRGMPGHHNLENDKCVTPTARPVPSWPGYPPRCGTPSR